MTPTERNAKLEEVRAALAKATPGPWHHHDMELVTVCGPDRLSIALLNAVSRPKEQNEANADLVKNAPAYLAFLLGEVERLEGECDLCPEMEAQVAYGLKLKNDLAVAKANAAAFENNFNGLLEQNRRDIPRYIQEEREECAKVVEDAVRLKWMGQNSEDSWQAEVPQDLRPLAARIRARK